MILSLPLMRGLFSRELLKLNILRGCIDTAEFGESLLEQMGYRLNTAETAYIRRNDREFQHLRTHEPTQQGWDMTM